ncbi:retrovirus-related pol polyprotein from transposon TNT 1-94 [Tanacetum coccineum]
MFHGLLVFFVKSKPNGKLIYNSIMNGPYVRRMIPEPGDPDSEVPVAETFHEQTDDELTEKEVKQMEADDQAIQIILMGLPKDIYAVVDSCETAQKIWLHVQQMMKGSDIRIQDKKAKLFNEWERFTYTDGESIESYYHCFSKLMNDFKRNKHFLEKIASNLKFLNNLQPEWRRHVTIVHQTKDLHEVDYTQLYDFLKYNQAEMQMVEVQTVRNQVVQNAVQNPRIQNVGNQNGLIVVLGIANLNANQIGNGNVVATRTEGNGNGNNENQIRCYNCRGLGHLDRNCTARPRKRDDAYLQTQLLAQKEEAEIQLQAEEFDFMAAAGDLDEIEEIDKAPVYDSDGSAKVHEYDNCYNNEIFNRFTQEEQYTELLDPIPEPYQVQQNDSNVISAVSSVEQSEGTVEQHPATAEETRALYDLLYNNLAIEVEKVKTVNHKIKETNVDLTTELLRYKNLTKITTPMIATTTTKITVTTTITTITTNSRIEDKKLLGLMLPP